jgi:hypothetical protein
VLFVVDPTTPFNGTTYTVPANVTNHFITGCAPNGIYNVTSASTANGTVVTVTPSASGSQADAAGVLVPGAIVATVPILNVALSPPNITLSWPTNAGDLVLNYTSSLVPPITWTPITTGITVKGTIYTITVPTEPGNGFYQLIAP